MKRLILSLCLFFIVSFSYAQSPATLAGIRRQVRIDIRDSTSTVNINQMFTDADLNIKINQAQDYVVRNTKCLYNSSTTTVVSNQQEYLLPSDCMAIDRVTFPGITTPRLEGRTLAGIDAEIPSWSKTPAGTPVYYYRRMNYVGLYPKPSQAVINASSGTIVIDYFQRANPMTASTSTPFNGDMALQDYQTLIIEMTDIMCLNVMAEPNTNIVNQFTADIAAMKAWSSFRYGNDLNENVSVK